MKKIDSQEQFDQVMEEGRPFFILKHSLTCPISQEGYNEFSQFAADHSEMTFLYLTVQDARPLSNYIAEKFQVKHESPQAIFFVDSNVTWHASHWKVTYDELTTALKNSKAKHP